MLNNRCLYSIYRLSVIRAIDVYVSTTEQRELTNKKRLDLYVALIHHPRLLVLRALFERSRRTLYFLEGKRRHGEWEKNTNVRSRLRRELAAERRRWSTVRRFYISDRRAITRANVLEPSSRSRRAAPLSSAILPPVVTMAIWHYTRIFSDARTVTRQNNNAIYQRTARAKTTPWAFVSRGLLRAPWNCSQSRRPCNARGHRRERPCVTVRRACDI